MLYPIQIDPEILHGVPCFSGTRVPVQSLFVHLVRGRTLDYFLEQFPTVSREKAVAVLQLANEMIVNGPSVLAA